MNASTGAIATTHAQPSELTPLPLRRADRAVAALRDARLEPTPVTLAAVLVAGALAAVAAALLAASSDVLAAPLANGLYRALAIASWIGVGVQTWRLRPDSRLGPQLIAVGFAFALTVAMASADPYAFTFGRLTWVLLAALLVYELLAFPRGRIERRATARAFRAAVASISALWALLLLIAPQLPIGGIATRCAGGCPENPFRLFDASGALTATLGDLATLATSALVCGVALLLAQRLRAVRGLERATLAPPFACLLVFAAAFALANALRTATGDGAAALALGWVSLGAALLVPWALLAGQLRGRLIVSGLIERRNVALEQELHATARELRASRSRIFAAGAHERRRIERDLHDSGQNRLVALRIRLDLAAAHAAAAGCEPLRAELAELGEEVQEALEAVRAIAHGIYPPLLATGGLPMALAVEAERASAPVRVRGDGTVPRSTPDAEAAVWFCCLEAIQNACKHAGAGARIEVRLDCAAATLRFCVEDDGAGIAPGARDGGGLTGMRDRVAAVGGTLAVGPGARGGTRVQGSAPWPERGP